MMVIDFTPVLHFFAWGMVLLLVVAAGGIIACLGSADRKARTWVETSDFVRSLRAADVDAHRSRRHVGVGRSAGRRSAPVREELRRAAR